MSKIQSYESLIWLPKSGPIVQLLRDDLNPRAEMGPKVGWSSLLIELFWLTLIVLKWLQKGLIIFLT